MNPFDSKTFNINSFKPFEITTVPGQNFCLKSVIDKLSDKTILIRPGTSAMIGSVIIMLSNEIVWIQSLLKKEKEEDRIEKALKLEDSKIQKLKDEENALTKEEKIKLDSEFEMANKEREKLMKKLENLNKLNQIKVENEKLLESIKKLEKDSIFSPRWE